MFVQAIIIAASAAFASAQVVYNSTTGQFVCPASNPNGTFCAGDSLSTNIIIRCVNGIGGPGNCNDNLSGYPPLGVNFAACWQSTPTAGDAACSKNCEVICASGGCGNGTITLPNCTPISSSSSSAPTSTSSSSSASATVSSTTSATGSTTTTSTGTTTITTGSTTTTETFTTTFCPSSSLTTSIVTGTGGASGLPGNGTVTTGSATKTPTGPTTTSSTGSTFTGAANAYSPAVGGTLAGIGLVVAYFL